MLLSLLLLLVCLFLEARAKEVKSGKPSYVDVGSKQKFRCVATGGRRPPMENMAQIRRPKKKTSDSHTPLDDESPKNWRASKRISEPNGSSWSSHPFARFKQMVFSWNPGNTLS